MALECRYFDHVHEMRRGGRVQGELAEVKQLSTLRSSGVGI